MTWCGLRAAAAHRVRARSFERFQAIGRPVRPGFGGANNWMLRRQLRAALHAFGISKKATVWGRAAHTPRPLRFEQQAD